MEKIPYTISQVTTEEEYALCLEVRRLVFTEEQGISAELDIDPLSPSDVNFLLFADDLPRGTGRYHIGNGYVKFERVAILPELRGKGAGRALMGAMEAKATRDHPKYLQILESQVSAIPFYEKLGWVPFGEVNYHGDTPHRWMGKALNS